MELPVVIQIRDVEKKPIFYIGLNTREYQKVKQFEEQMVPMMTALMNLVNELDIDDIRKVYAMIAGSKKAKSDFEPQIYAQSLPETDTSKSPVNAPSLLAQPVKRGRGRPRKVKS
jgi:hypothetical protein